MANPGFPPHMQPPGGPGMPGMPGMPGGMPHRPSGIPMAGGAVRKGTPKIVPVVVSAGLAVGVFCGLYFGLGTGEPKEAEADTTAKATGVTGPQTAAGATDEQINFKSANKPPSELNQGSGSDTVAPPPQPPPPPGTGSGSAATPPPGTGSATTPPPPPAPLTLDVTFAITPADAELTIDGAPAVGGKVTITFGDDDKKTVRVVAKAKGFKTYDKKMTFTKDTAQETIEIKLGKRGSSSPRPPHGHDHDREPPGGLIDL